MFLTHSILTIRDYTDPVPSWVLRLSLRSESQSCVLKFNTFMLYKSTKGQSWECLQGTTHIDWHQVFQASSAGVRKGTGITWGSWHAIQSFWRSSVTSYCSWRDSSLHVWENELLPLVLTFWELLSSGFWQFYPHTSARQLGWMSLKHCQW